MACVGKRLAGAAAGLIASLGVAVGEEPVAASSLADRPSAPARIELSPAARQALGVATAPLIAPSVAETVRAVGVVEAPPGAVVTLDSPFAATVVRTLVLPGEAVAVGAGVAVLRSPDFAAAKAQFDAARLMDEHRRELAARARELFRLGLRSKEEADEAAHDAQDARLSLRALEERLAFVRAEPSPGEFMLIAPGDGVAVEMPARTGAQVEAGARVATFFGGGEVWARAQAPADLSRYLSVGGAVRVVDDAAGRVGAVAAIDASIDPQTRSVGVLARLPDGGSQKLGALVDLVFEVAVPPGALLAPSRAVVRMGGRDVLFVEDGDGFRPTPIEVLSRGADGVLLRGAAREGDCVAISGIAALKNIAGGA